MKTVGFILSFAIEIAYMVRANVTNAYLSSLSKQVLKSIRLLDICEPITMLSNQHVFYMFT